MILLAAAMGVDAPEFVTRKEVATNDDVSDVDDVDLECRWRSTYRSASRRNREVAEKIATAL